MENGGWSGPRKHPPPRPHHLTLQVADTRHPYTSRGETSDNATTKQAQTLEKPCQSRLGTQQECAGHQKLWRRQGRRRANEQKGATEHACTRTQRTAHPTGAPNIRTYLHAPRPCPENSPADHKRKMQIHMHAELSAPCANCRRTRSNKVLNGKAANEPR